MTTIVTGHYVFIALPLSAFPVNVSSNNYVSQCRDVTLTTNQTLSFQKLRKMDGWQEMEASKRAA
jgi:hypothetical protein